jgi:CRISPR-associated protein Csb2
MSSHFCLSVTLHDATFHGCRDDGVPEWPPSPLRAFQSLLAAAAARWREPQFGIYAAPALEWLEGLGPPEILAPAGRTASLPYRLYVPNNAGDLVVKAWASGSADASIAAHRTEKDVRPTRLVGGDAFTGGNMVRFVWRLPVDPSVDVGEYAARLSAAARSLTHLGWGIDMAAGHAGLMSEQELLTLLDDPRLERWTPGAGGTPLRAPRPKTAQGPGTFHSLVGRHEAFTRRMTGGKPQDVPSLTAFAVVGYRRATDTAGRPFAAFQLLTPDAERKWGRDARWTIEVAGMVRHATKLAAIAVDKPQSWIDTFVLGHGSGKNQQAVGEEGARRFSYVPLPTIRPQGVVGQVNRVLIVEPPGGTGADAAWARRMLSGQELIEEKKHTPVALLSLAPASDWVVRQYTGDKEGAAVWSTVTPVVLPGYDDPDHLRRRLKDVTTSEAKRRLHERLDARIDGLLRKAIRQAGFPATLAACAELSWRLGGFRPGLDLATRYDWPDHLKGKPRYHVRIHWKNAAGDPVNVHGPVVLGAGRYCGLGLFAVTDERPAKIGQ